MRPAQAQRRRNAGLEKGKKLRRSAEPGDGLFINIEVSALVDIIRAARRRDAFGIRQIVEDRVLKEIRGRGDLRAARVLEGSLTNEKRRLSLHGVDLMKIEEAWIRSSVGQAKASANHVIYGNQGVIYTVHRDDWLIVWDHSGRVHSYLEALPHFMLARFAELDWTPVGPEISPLDALVKGMAADEA